MERDDPPGLSVARPSIEVTDIHAPTRVRWVMLALLVAASFVIYLLRYNLSIAGDAMMEDLGLDKVQFGMVLAAFAWSYGLCQFPGAVLGERFGSRRTFTLLFLAWGMLTLALGLLPQGLPAATVLGLLIGLRVLMGMAQAPFFPVVAGVIGRWFPPNGWALPNGLSSTGLTLGSAATGPIVAWLTVALGWRIAFAVLAPTAFVLAAVWFWYARDNPAEHRSVSRTELQLIERGRLPSTHSDSGLVVLKSPQLWLLTLSYFCMNYVFYVFFNWFYIYLLEVRGFSALEGGFVAALPWLIGALFATIGGWWCDRLSRVHGLRFGCRLPAVLGLLLVAALLPLGALAPSAPVAVILLSLCFASTQFTEAPYWSAVIGIADRHASAGAGMLNTGGNVVGGLSALLVPLVADTIGWVPALSTGSLFAIVAAACWFFIEADRPLSTTRRGPP